MTSPPRSKLSRLPKLNHHCEKCPWKKAANPHEIPNGYEVQKHKNLKDTIATPANFDDVFKQEIRTMACHETHDSHCIGWLENQLGPGNNIGLRLHIRNCDNFDQVETFGEQHETFEATLPKSSPKNRRKPQCSTQ